ncbi:MAG: dTMP kinase [Rickettsiales bacterium]|nr:dTMP kinase [Rickettsiales bacterium]
MEKLKGKFITFEGGDGAGKSTQSRLFVEYLNKNGREAVWSREPGGCVEAEEIRQLLLKGETNKWDGITELLLLYAARRVHTERKIKPLLDRNITVVSDRYFDSSLAYQGFGHGLPLPAIDSLRHIVLGDFEPDLTIILDIDTETGLDRSCRGGGKNRYESMTLEFHRRVKDGFDYIYKANPKRCIKIDVADASIETLSRQILEKVEQFFR